jgi:hypothetical protein
MTENSKENQISGNLYSYSKITLLIPFIFSIVHIYAATISSSFSFLLITSIVLRFISYATALRKNLTFLIFWTYFELSFFGYIALSPLTENFTISSFSLHIGELSLSVLLIFQLLFNFLLFKKSIEITPLKIKKISLAQSTALLIIIPFLLTFISYKLNIIVMGVERPVLPFKIEHILNLSRSIVIPFFFTLFMGRSLTYSSRSKKKFLIYLVIFNIWLALETILRGSKGFILITNFPTILLLIHHNSRKFLKRMILAMIVLAPIVFIIGKAIRIQNVNNKNISTLINLTNNSLSNQLLEIYQRNFYDAEIVNKFHPYVKDQSFQSLIKRFSKEKGSMKFHTNIIDDASKHKGHSSGTTLIADGYFMLGQTGIILSIFLLVIMITFNDRLSRVYLKNESGVYCFGIFWIYTLTFWSEGFWSFFLYRSPLTTMIFPSLAITISLVNRKYSNN